MKKMSWLVTLTLFLSLVGCGGGGGGDSLTTSLTTGEGTSSLAENTPAPLAADSEPEATQLPAPTQDPTPPASGGDGPTSNVSAGEDVQPPSHTLPAPPESDSAPEANDSPAPTQDSTAPAPDAVALLEGRLIDSPVAGARFKSGPVSGVTAADGSFTYPAGASVQFFIGDILLGEAVGGSIISPVELVADAEDELNPIVTNIARFLQALDDDGNPENGITVSEQVADLATGESINFAQSIEQFEADGTVQVLVATLTSVTRAGPRQLASARQAQDHLRTALLRLRAGTYELTFADQPANVIEIVVKDNGDVFSGVQTNCTRSSSSSSGSASSSCSSSVSISKSGSVDTRGQFNATLGSGSELYTVEGTIDADGKISGTWRSERTSETGSFEGVRKVVISF